MDFVEVRVLAPRELADILVAELAEVGYDTFEDHDEGFCAYIGEGDFNPDAVAEVMARYSGIGTLDYSHRIITRQNWNAEWEKNFQPLIIADRVSVRAPFHPKPEPIEYDIVIMPRMSFGTGHHETTALMIENQLGVDHAGKRVLDMGCGTGILAIMAAQLGAREVLAVDVEPWTVENAADNAAENHCANIECRLGGVEVLAGEAPFDLILANINRNVLLEDMYAYAALLPTGAPILFSGFYQEDLALIEEEAKKHKLAFQSHLTKNNWVSAVFTKVA
ncbi:ribosomal L11 methyltransferase [Hymenobacter roseosalivarius DSM 11622]|uniref:Ribosomal protein L11 methyltransferase n=1 Tax=Hymenobacter roseosalivarius DSM 11622 TaxID=645990 RepID=A0A1W1V1D4_9BACT|nr:50S ribosomal protein L11 methyltransferase [Hymenobacter roseosalivarius]SMB87167.1 ribosomal L11 methyltransferase [Hymenobacter roseosalivarius DSM 11622]